MTKKVVILNGSPRAEKGMTEHFLVHLVKGFEENGCQISKFNVAKMNIKPCGGELSCWLKLDGGCIYDDDMQIIRDSLLDCEILVLATPVYVDGMTAQLKGTMDRLVSTALPYVEMVDGHLRHPARNKDKKPFKIVLLSTCGFWEMDNFDPLIHHIQAICKNLRSEFTGALVRPHAGAIPMLAQMGEKVDDIYQAAYDAGKELAIKGTISEGILKEFSRTAVSQELYFQNLNYIFEEEIKKNKSKAK